jgi:NTP pyrophosphatase (non-canonical NTP hydrolase)
MTTYMTSELQAQVAEMETRRGFSDDTLLEKCLLLGEEMGELFKVVRELSGMLTSHDSRASCVESELADVAIVLCTIANRLELDVGEVVMDKLRSDDQRRWSARRPRLG